MKLFKNLSIRRFTIYTLFAGTVIGYYSALSDSIHPWEEMNWWQILNYAISNIVNDFVFWFVMAIVTTYIFTRTWRRAVLYGAIVSCYSIIAYLVCNMLIPNSGAVFDVVGSAIFAIAAICGGALGGLIGHMIKKYPIVLVAPLGFTLYRLRGALPETWNSAIGLPRNIFLCAVIAAILGYWAFRIYRKPSISP